ncbi:MAG: hypothetical protein Q9187_007843 [Circinaria calcarea]
MVSKKKKPKKPKLLSHTRPPVHNPPTSLSSRATRTLIRTHHTLQKQLTQALNSNNEILSASLRAQIEASGGLRTYQRASITGQSSSRGGDSSRILMEWLSPLLSRPNPIEKFKMLEVGALSPHNACSRSRIFEMQRIDLHSQHPSIMQQDFMLRPVPAEEKLEEDGFDIVSLSLVVNFVAEAPGRGEMLKRVGKFLRRGTVRGGDGEGKINKAREFFPSLFLVLPSSCVLNSRYMNEERFEDIIASLGFVLARRKSSEKLVYYLWSYQGGVQGRTRSFGKEELRKGGCRNNFAIVLR